VNAILRWALRAHAARNKMNARRTRTVWTTASTSVSFAR
jgi:hypothetical protein